MCRTWYVLASVALYVGLAQSWDFAVTKVDTIEFYTNRIKTDAVSFDSQNLTALIYNEVHNMMLYVDKQSGNDTICSYDISSKENKCFTERSGRDIHGLAFDPVTEKLFFTDTKERSINWISVKHGIVDNIYGNLLIRTGGDGIPTDIAVDSHSGYVYWINTNLTPPTIERARFDGSQREAIITLAYIDSPNKVEPHSLVFDPYTQKIFWIEPKTRFEYHIYYADLNGNNKYYFNHIKYLDPRILLRQPSSNTMTVSKTRLFFVDWCLNCDITMWEIRKSLPTSMKLHTIGVTVVIATNNKIEEKLPETPGSIGQRCDVSVCNNYCLHGNCSSNDEGLPKCRCYAGYSGNRCEVYACHGYCLNNGVCSLNEMGEASCQCVGKHEGPRCEGVQNFSCTNKIQY